MSRPFSVVEQVKDRLSMVDVVGRAVPLKQNGNGHVGNCPFHAEKSGSFKVWDTHAHCFGCGWHGDVITFTEQTRGLPFKEALRELADEAGVQLREDPEAEARRQKHRSRAALLRAAAELYHAALPDDARKYLRGRGFADAFVDAYLIGFAAGDKVRALGPEADLVDAGLLVERQGGKPRDALYNRLVFPIWGRYDDEIVGLAGRAWPEDREPKYVAVPGGPAPLLNERGLRHPDGRRADGRFVFLLEGDTDTASGVQQLGAVVGVRGVQGLRDDMVPLFAGVDAVYVGADGDKAGPLMVHRAGAAFGNRVRVLPIPPGEDVNSYCAQQGHSLLQLAAKAPAYLDWMLERVPPEVAPDQVERQVEAFVEPLLAEGRVAQEVYSKKLAQRLKITVHPIREALRLAADARKTESNGVTSFGQKLGPIFEDKPRVNPAQFVHADAMHVTIPVPAWVEDKDGRPEQRIEPYVVSARRELWRLTPDEMGKRGLAYREQKAPKSDLVLDRWSRGDDAPYSLKNWLDGGAQVDPVALVAEVAGHYRRYVHYPNDRYYDFLALWSIGTYVYALFYGYPYCHLHSYKEAGKSLTMDVAKGLAWNAVSSSSMSPAAMYRIIESCSPTFLIDEAENLGTRRKDADQVDDKLEILKAGYKPGFPAIRCDGDAHEPRTYDVYSPKMFGSIQGVESVLSARMITLRLARAPQGTRLQEFRDEPATKALFQATRDKLYCWALEYGADVQQRITEGIDADLARFGAHTGWSDLRNRDRELWTPILVLAVLFDDYAVAAGAEPDPENLLTIRMMRLAQETVEQRRAREAQEQFEVALIEGLLEFVSTYTGDRPSGMQDWYPSNALLEYLKGTAEGLDWLKDCRQVYRELEKTGVIPDRSRDWIGRKTLGSVKQVRAVRIERKRLLETAGRLGARTPEDE